MESIIGCKPEFPDLNDLLLFGFLIYYFGFTLMAKSKEKLKLFPLLLFVSSKCARVSLSMLPGFKLSR
jgi:hypothetical protein